MVGVIIRIVILGAIVLLIAGGIGLFVMAGVAQSHDVVHIPVPPNTYASSTEPMADYSDAFIAPMNYSVFSNIDRVAQQAFHRGDREVFRDEHEVAYEGTKFGLKYTVSYILEKDQSPQTLTVATTVKVVDPKKRARYLIMIGKPIHHCLIPYLLDRMVILAPD